MKITIIINTHRKSSTLRLMSTYSQMYSLTNQIGLRPVGKIAKKNRLKGCAFVNSAFKIQCHIVKNTLLQTAFAKYFGKNWSWTFATQLCKKYLQNEYSECTPVNLFEIAGGIQGWIQTMWKLSFHKIELSNSLKIGNKSRTLLTKSVTVNPLWYKSVSYIK